MIEDRELVALCEAAIAGSMGQGPSGELSSDRAKAMDYYMGNMEDYLPAEEGRSEFVSRDVLDTVEWVLPSLMKIFLDAENVVEFEAVGPEDEEQARVETLAVRKMFFDMSPAAGGGGFLTLYSFCKDALLSKTGIVKSYVEDPGWEREEYDGLTQDEFVSLINEPGVEVQILEQSLNPDGTMALVAATRRRAPLVVSDPVPPEEFGISADVRSPMPRRAPFVFHRTRKSASELVEMGFDRKVVEGLPFEGDSDWSDEQRIARYADGDDLDLEYAVHKSMRQIWVSECYIRVDDNDDGIAELLKVTLAGDSPGGTLLEREEVDGSYFACASPVMITHRFDGLSLADLVMEIQDIRTSLIRGISDNTRLSNAQRMAVNELVNLDDMLVSRAGGVVRTEGAAPPSQNIMPLVHPPVPQETFGVLELMDKIIKNRTGVGDEVMGLDTDALSNINTGVMLQAYEAARMRIELMARVLAECGIKEIFRNVHELMCKNIDRPLMMQLGGQGWVRVSPSEWRTRTNLTVNVGTGRKSHERRMMENQDMLQTQMTVMQAGVVSPQHLLATLADKARLLGKDPGMYFGEPPPPPPPPPDPAMIMAQANMAKVQIEEKRLGIDLQRAQLDAQIKEMASQMKLQEASMKKELEETKAMVLLRRQVVDEQSQVMNAATMRDRQESEERMAEMRLEWQKVIDSLKADLDKYKADLGAVTSLVDTQSRRDEVVMRLQNEIKEMRRQLSDERGSGEQAAGDDGEGQGGAS